MWWGILEFILRSWDFDCRLLWNSDIVEISSKAQRTCVRLIWPFFPQEIPLNLSCFSFSGDKMETFERSQVIFHMSLKLKMATRIWWAILELILDSLTFDCKLISWQFETLLRSLYKLLRRQFYVSQEVSLLTVFFPPRHQWGDQGKRSHLFLL